MSTDDGFVSPGRWGPKRRHSRPAVEPTEKHRNVTRQTCTDRPGPRQDAAGTLAAQHPRAGDTPVTPVTCVPGSAMARRLPPGQLATSIHNVHMQPPQGTRGPCGQEWPLGKDVLPRGPGTGLRVRPRGQPVRTAERPNAGEGGQGTVQGETREAWEGTQPSSRLSNGFHQANREPSVQVAPRKSRAVSLQTGFSSGSCPGGPP